MGSRGGYQSIDVPFSYQTDVTGCSCIEDGTCALIALHWEELLVQCSL